MRRLVCAVGLGVVLALCSPAWCQVQALAVPSPATAPAMRPAADPAHSAITEYRLPSDKLRQAAELYQIRKFLQVVSPLWGLATLLLLLELRVGPRFRDWAEAASRRRFAQVALFVPLLTITLGMLNLPLGVYRHHLQAAYGLSVQGWASWLWDWTKGHALSIALLTLLGWGFYAILRRWPRHWWFWGWVGAAPVLALLVFLHPLVIDPLFNKFDPLAARQPALVGQMEKVVQRGGLSIPRSRMFEMRASEKLTTYNAYVTGLGASKRVVVWDNTTRDLTVPQILFIFAHEQGHYVLHHVRLGVAAGAAGLFIGLYLARGAIGFLLAWRGARWGIRGLSDWASLPALLLVVSVLQLVSQPIGAGFSRYLEHQADIYALEITHGLVPDSSEVAAQAFQRLGEKGLAFPAPDPLLVFWTYTHPPIADRVRFALSYQPWRNGGLPRYIK